jgi:hypothetical protein
MRKRYRVGEDQCIIQTDHFYLVHSSYSNTRGPIPEGPRPAHRLALTQPSFSLAAAAPASQLHKLCQQRLAQAGLYLVKQAIVDDHLP